MKQLDDILLRAAIWVISLIQTWSRRMLPEVHGFGLKFRRVLDVRSHQVIVKLLCLGVWVNTYCVALLRGELQCSRVFK